MIYELIINSRVVYWYYRIGITYWYYQYHTGILPHAILLWIISFQVFTLFELWSDLLFVVDGTPWCKIIWTMDFWEFIVIDYGLMCYCNLVHFWFCLDIAYRTLLIQLSRVFDNVRGRLLQLWHVWVVPFGVWHKRSCEDVQLLMWYMVHCVSYWDKGWVNSLCSPWFRWLTVIDRWNTSLTGAQPTAYVLKVWRVTFSMVQCNHLMNDVFGPC